MATRKEHTEQAAYKIHQADKAERSGEYEKAKRLTEASKAHSQIAESMRPDPSARPTRPLFGTTRISKRGR